MSQRSRRGVCALLLLVVSLNEAGGVPSPITGRREIHVSKKVLLSSTYRISHAFTTRTSNPKQKPNGILSGVLPTESFVQEKGETSPGRATSQSHPAQMQNKHSDPRPPSALEIAFKRRQVQPLVENLQMLERYFLQAKNLKRDYEDAQEIRADLAEKGRQSRYFLTFSELCGMAANVACDLKRWHLDGDEPGDLSRKLFFFLKPKEESLEGRVVARFLDEGLPDVARLMREEQLQRRRSGLCWRLRHSCAASEDWSDVQRPGACLGSALQSLGCAHPSVKKSKKKEPETASKSRKPQSEDAKEVQQLERQGAIKKAVKEVATAFR
uniref:SPX domain-containing protein n=1 Tax=Chromera velia CCMP2878 TaxID=1169474 RepID=A0A0G4H3A7_9ALVE|eukprot:Cvel_24532.t1-p1 / transcript=Cvel_24532.t1 / gene=Cvel_24532 / organism=Chromera_velia_CCMP2878 / gene_product=hypothetical protein / transcript_product=hypothetical protein / location=Cvel_scaffold2663:1499-2473(+) / protein_length=325 / sequence_SO=supercontig / SO=protein_coding / is_pseudo=false